MEYTFTVANFEEEVLNSPLPVLVDFYADWCNPCKMMAPTVAKLAEAYEGKVKVGKINVDENMTIAQKYRVASIPNFVIFRDGQPVANFVGAVSGFLIFYRYFPVMLSASALICSRVPTATTLPPSATQLILLIYEVVTQIIKTDPAYCPDRFLL